MASSSDEALDESIPEMVYQSVSLIDAANCRREDSHIKCPLCNTYQSEKCFFCADCVKNGNFWHSKKKCLERFADKKPTKYKLDEEKANLLKRYEEVLSKKKEIEDIKVNIHLYKDKIQLLQKSINSCKNEISNDKKKIEDLKEKKAESLKDQQKVSEKISKLCNYSEEKNIELEHINTALSSKNQELHTFVQSSIEELVTYIFPITEVPPISYRDASTSEEGKYAELEEAQKTTYVQGQWVITGSPFDEIQYAIVEPFIPSTGDYSAYTSWWADREKAISSRDDLSIEDRRRFDAAFRTSAALAYVTQFVKILTIYLDVNVPKRPSYNDFCRFDTAGKFNHHVAKLNANIIHLCLARQVDIAELSAHRTISNLLLLIDPKPNQMRSSLTLEEKEEILESLEESITKDMLPPDESDDDIEAEYVHVSDDEDLFQVPESAPIPPSFVSSVFSLWRTATGQK